MVLISESASETAQTNTTTVLLSGAYFKKQIMLISTLLMYRINSQETNYNSSFASSLCNLRMLGD